MVYLLKMGISHGKLLNNQMVNDIHLGFAVCRWNFGFATFSPQLAGDPLTVPHGSANKPLESQPAGLDFLYLHRAKPLRATSRKD